MTISALEYQPMTYSINNSYKTQQAAAFQNVNLSTGDTVSFKAGNGKKKNYLPLAMIGLPIAGFALAFGPFGGPLVRPSESYHQ